MTGTKTTREAPETESDAAGATATNEAAIDLSWDCTHAGGLTFVGVRVRNPASVPRRVRLTNRLDGPLLPPRSDGAPEPGYDADGVVAGVAAGDCEPVGFACPAAPPGDDEPPVRVASVERVADAAAVPERSPTERARGGLGDAAPPREAVTGARQERGAETGPIDAAEPSGAAADAPAFDRWLAAVEARVETGERLTGTSVPAATDALGAAGDLDGVAGDGLDAVAELDRRLAADAERLREVAARAETLAERAAATEVPVEALRRLA